MSASDNNNKTKELPFPKVQRSWILAQEIAAKDESKAFGTVFYKTLFEDYPFLKEQDFKNTDTAGQRMNLTKFITTALSLLGTLPDALEALSQLGMRHILYQTKDAYWPVVGANVIKTLKIILPAEDFDKETEEEWATLYGIMQKTILDAIHSDRALPFWKRFWKKRGGDFAKLIDGIDCSAKTGIKQDLATISKTVQEQQSVAVIESLVGGMTQAQVDSLQDNIIASINAKKGGDVSLGDKFIIEWFAGEFQKAKAKETAAAASSSKCGSCCGSTTKCAVTVGVIAAAVAVGAWFFLKK